MMTPNNHRPEHIERAAAQLAGLGIEICPPPPDRLHVAFSFPRVTDGQVFADRSGRYFREEFIDGRFINPMGYRQDVHEVLREYRLVTDWCDENTIDVYHDPQAPGWQHGYTLYLSEVEPSSRTATVRLPTDERAAILDGTLEEREGIAAFQWDGRDPAFAQLSLAERVQARETTPLPQRSVLLGIFDQLVASVVSCEHDLSKPQDEIYKLSWGDSGARE